MNVNNYGTRIHPHCISQPRILIPIVLNAIHTEALLISCHITSSYASATGFIETLTLRHICNSHVRLITTNFTFIENTTCHLSELALIVTLEHPSYKVWKHIETNRWYTRVNPHRGPLCRSRLFVLYVVVERKCHERNRTPRRRDSCFTAIPNFHYVHQPPIQPYTSAITHTFLPHLRRYLSIILHFPLGGFDFISHSYQCLFIYAHFTLSQPTDSAKHPPNTSIIALCILKFVVGTRTK